LVQGISGFAFAMVAMSIWVWGVDPALAALTAVFGGVTGQIISAIATHAHSARSLQLAALSTSCDLEPVVPTSRIVMHE
jgi:hypothetical protein